MGPKCKLIIGVILILVLVVSFVFVHIITTTNEENYCEKIVSLLKDKDTITVKEIFSFEFEKAYIFNDCYISGEGFAERYNLNVSIEQVESGVSENIQRIVFVDEDGSFVHEFKCDRSEIIVSEEGTVIFPDTIIKKESSDEETPLLLYFESMEYYDYWFEFVKTQSYGINNTTSLLWRYQMLWKIKKMN